MDVELLSALDLIVDQKDPYSERWRRFYEPLTESLHGMFTAEIADKTSQIGKLAHLLITYQKTDDTKDEIKQLLHEMIQILEWGVSHPEDVGITPYWLQKRWLLTPLFHWLGEDGLRLLFSRLVKLSSEETKFNLEGPAVGGVLYCYHSSFPRFARDSPTATDGFDLIVFPSEACIWVPKVTDKPKSWKALDPHYKLAS